MIKFPASRGVKGWFMSSIELWLKENQITEVECLIPDITGNARGKFIPADKFIKEDRKAVIFPEGRITVTGSLMKVYEGPALVADKADAMILPIAMNVEENRELFKDVVPKQLRTLVGMSYQ